MNDLKSISWTLLQSWLIVTCANFVFWAVFGSDDWWWIASQWSTLQLWAIFMVWVNLRRSIRREARK